MEYPLPKKITPNPLLSSTVEIRFSSELSSDEVFSKLYPKFSKELPKLETRRLPKDKNQDQKHLAEYILTGKGYQIFLDNDVIAFENIGEYHLWDNYLPFIKNNIEILSDSGIVKSIDRIGLRYISFFEITERLSNVLNIEINTPFESYRQSNDFFRTQLYKGDTTILLHLLQNAEIQKDDKIYNGILIDIDASQTEDLPNLIDNRLIDIIENLHSEEKLLFFSLLKKSFIEKLNPQY